MSMAGHARIEGEQDSQYGEKVYNRRECEGFAFASHEGMAMAGIYGNATAGDYGTAITGNHGVSIAGWLGTAISGYCGHSTAGDKGTAVAGAYGHAITGERGVAIAGVGGYASAGLYGTIVLQFGQSLYKQGSGTERFNDCIKGVIGVDTDKFEVLLQPDTLYTVVDNKLVSSKHDYFL